MSLKHKNKGFTLIELLVVIAIIGILSSVVLTSLNTARKKARDARRQADLSNLQLSIVMFKDANSDNAPSALSGLVPTYTTAIPVDPLNSGSNVYTYSNTPADASFCLSAFYETTQTGGAYYFCDSGGCRNAAAVCSGTAEQ